MLFTRIYFLSFILVLSLAAMHAGAQDVIRCATQQLIEQHELQQPGTKANIQQIAQEARDWVKNNPGVTRSIITIPVVVHVIYKTSAQNISDEQVQSQIDVLNEDFRLANTDTSKIPQEFWPVAADCEIQFCLAAYDPNGDSTSGIIRTQTDTALFTTGDNMKFTAKGGDDAWPPKHYLNIWTCNLGNNTLGYATPPQGNSGSSKTDGVVVLYRAFGREPGAIYPYNQGRTCTHEVGHWLGLSHIWGDDQGSCSGSDDIDDTPNQADSNFGCPAFPTISCSNGPNGDMFMNYMDYTDDRCMYMFTNDQAAVMNATLNGTRKTILTSPAGCQGVSFANDASVSKVLYAEDTVDFLSFYPQVQLTNRGFNVLTSAVLYYQVDGQEPAQIHWTGNLATGESDPVIFPDLYFTSEGDHIATAWCSQPNDQPDEFIFNDTASNDFTVASSVDKNTLMLSASPTAGPINIYLENPSAGDMDLRVVNMLGQVVQHHYITLNTQSSITLDLSNLSPGMYILYSKIGYDYTRNKVMVVR